MSQLIAIIIDCHQFSTFVINCAAIAYYPPTSLLLTTISHLLSYIVLIIAHDCRALLLLASYCSLLLISTNYYQAGDC